MTVNIETTEDKVFKQYLTIINPVLGKQKLSPTEIEVMSNFLYIQHKYAHLPKEKLDKIAFHTATKKIIRQSIKEQSNISLSEASFNNQLLSLRKKKFLDGNTIIHKPFFNKEGNISLTFNLNLVK